jgi:hypothetical protein
MIFLIFNNKWATKIVTGLNNPNPKAGPVYLIHTKIRIGKQTLSLSTSKLKWNLDEFYGV